MKIAVLGGGHGCYAAAADLAEHGHDLTLWRRGSDKLAGLLENKSIDLTDAAGTRSVVLHRVTDQLADAVADAHIIIIPLPAVAQQDLAVRLAPLLRDDQVVYLPPGTFGSYLFARAMADCGNTSRVAFGETGTLPYLARKKSETHVTISVRATRLPTGIFPARHSDWALPLLIQVFPAIEPLKDALDGALMNAGPIIHPPLIMMNAGPLQHFDAWDIHNEGTQPAIRAITDALDNERIQLRQALGYGAPHFPLADHYDDSRDEWMYGNSSHEKLTDSGDWREKIDLHSHRYMREDLALGLVFYATLGDWANVDMPLSKGLISLASAVVGEDLIQGSRAWGSLGLGDMSKAALGALLRDGIDQ